MTSVLLSEHMNKGCKDLILLLIKEHNENLVTPLKKADMKFLILPW